MAARVNTKFVVILGISIAAIVAALLAYYLIAIQRSPGPKIDEGMRLREEGRYADAAKRFGQAVGRDRTNIPNYELWHETILMIVPKNETVNREFFDQHLSILKTLAQLQPADAARQEAFLSELWEISRLSQAYDSFVTQANEHIVAFQATTTDTDAVDHLRRYRGLGNLRRMELFTDMDDEDRAEALADLQAAFQADPADWETGLAVSRWHFAEVMRHRKDGRTREAEAAMGEALGAHEAFMERHPRHPEGLVLGYVFESDLRTRNVVTPQQMKEANAALTPLIDDMITLSETLPPDELRTPTFLGVLAREAGRVEGGHARIQKAMQRVLAARPDDIELKLASAVVQRAAGDYQGAIDTLDQVANAEDRSISIEQLRLFSQRLEALAAQVDTALTLWEESDDAATRAAALAQAKSFRDALATRVTSNFANELTLRDAKIAIVEGQYPVAIAKLSELQRSAMGDNPIVGLLMARVLELQGNLGQALEEYRKLPRSTGVLLAMARLQVRLQDFSSAETMLLELLARDPENAEGRQLMDQLAAMKSPGEGDPLFASLIEARKSRVQGEYDTARSILTRLRTEHPDDPRAYLEMVYVEVNAGQRDLARQLADEAAGRFPEHRTINNIRIVLNESDPIKGQILVINADDTTSDVQKMLARYHIYRGAAKRATAAGETDRAGEMDDKAVTELNSALAAGPADPVVIEVAFVDAIERGDQRRMAEYKDTAARTNADQLNGMLYQARYDIVVNQDYQSAERLLDDALTRIPNNPPAWRLLGQVQRELGKQSEALESFARARQGRPDDVAITREYLSQLITMNRPVEALAAVKADTGGALRYAPNDPELINLWLDLEAQIGDRRLARQKRLELYQAQPANLRNTVALANIYATENRWDQVDGIVERLAEVTDNPLLVASLKTRSLLAQGQVDEAVTSYESFVSQQPADQVNETTWTTLARLLTDSGHEERAEAAYEKARQYQDQAERGVDRQLADHYFRKANDAMTNAAIFRDQNAGARAAELDAIADEYYTKARDAYKSVVDAGIDKVDEGYRVTKRLIETYLRLDDTASAESYLNRIAPALPDDLEVYLLRANLAEQKGGPEGRRQARAILAEAIGNPRIAGRPEPFLQRVLLNRQEPELFAAVVQDLDQIHRLDPSNTRAWALRYSLFRENGRAEDAFNELRRGINLNPANDELRLLLLRELVASNRLEQAAADVLAITGERPDSIEWKARAANILAQLNRWPEVARYYQEIYDETDSVDAAVALLDAKLRTPERTNVPEVNTLMQRIVRDEDHDETTVASTMLRARAYSFLKRPDDANAEIRRGLEAAGDSPGRQQLWLEQLILARGGPAAAYDYVESLNLDTPALVYLRVQLVNFRLVQGAENYTELLDQIKDVEQLTEDRLVRRELYRVRSRLNYELKDYSACVEWLRQAVEVADGDVELYNNLAYLLSNEMQDPQGALVYAERAAELRPLSSTVLDTLGWTYHLLDRDEEAVRVLSRAVNTATSDIESLIANVHLGLVYAAMERMSDARQCRAQAEDIARRNANAREQYRQELDQLSAKVQ